MHKANANLEKSKPGKKPTSQKANPEKNNAVKSPGKTNQAYSQPSPKPICPKCNPTKANPA